MTPTHNEYREQEFFLPLHAAHAAQFFARKFSRRRRVFDFRRKDAIKQLRHDHE